MRRPKKNKPIILNEIKEAKKILDFNVETTQKLDEFQMLSILSRYYYNVEHLSEFQVFLKLSEWIEKYIPEDEYNKKDWQKPLEYYSKNCNNAISNIDYIQVSPKELKTINTIPDKMSRIILFVLLCVAKYRNYLNNNNNNWTNITFQQLDVLTNYHISNERYCKLLYELKEKGLINLAKKITNTNIQVCFIDKEIDFNIPSIKIYSFEKLGIQYNNYTSNR